MKDSSVNRWLWLIGLVAAALIFVSFGPLSSGSPDENASGISVAHWYNTHVNQQWLTIWLVGLALFLLLVYVTQLRSVLVQTGGQRLWPNVVFASGILLVAGIVVAGSFEMTLIIAAHTHEYAVAHFVNFYSCQQRAADPRRHGLPDPLHRPGHPAQPRRRAAAQAARVVLHPGGAGRRGRPAQLPCPALRAAHLAHRHGHRDRRQAVAGHPRW